MAPISAESKTQENKCLHDDGVPFPDPSGFVLNSGIGQPTGAVSVNYGLPVDHTGELLLGLGGCIDEWPNGQNRKLKLSTPKFVEAEFSGELASLKEDLDLAVQAIFSNRPDRSDLESKFTSWLEDFLKKAEGELRSAFRSYRIPPSGVLKVIGPVKARELTHDREREEKRNSLKVRTAQAEAIQRATEFAEYWIPDLPELGLHAAYSAVTLFRELAEKIKSAPSVPGVSRTTQQHYGRIASFRLAEFLRSFDLGTKRYDSDLVESLIKHAFPDCVFYNDTGGQGSNTNKDVGRKIREGRMAEKYPAVEFKGLLCRHPERDPLDDDDWHFHPKCARWPKRDFVQSRFLNCNDPCICPNCAKLEVVDKAIAHITAVLKAEEPRTEKFGDCLAAVKLFIGEKEQAKALVYRARRLMETVADHSLLLWAVTTWLLFFHRGKQEVGRDTTGLH